MQDLLNEIRNCRICENKLSHIPNPILSGSPKSKILIIGQAPGRSVHESGIPWDDPSGEQLRGWLDINSKDFYDSDKVALVPMGFCYPGKGKTGDLPPRPECAEAWHDKVMAELISVKLTILIGQYAQKHYLKDRFQKNLTETVAAYKKFHPSVIPLPHPSPRNRFWLTRNPWFAQTLVPILQQEVKKQLTD